MYKYEESKHLYDSEALRIVERPDSTVAAGALNLNGGTVLDVLSRLNPAYKTRRLPDGFAYIIEVDQNNAYTFGKDVVTLLEGF